MAKEVVTKGFGTFGSIARVILRGFFSGEVVVLPSIDQIFTDGRSTPTARTGGARTLTIRTDGARTPTVTTAGEGA